MKCLCLAFTCSLVVTLCHGYPFEQELRLPDSYRTFLKLHNGYDGLTLYGNMLSIQEMMPGGEEFGYISEWKEDYEADGWEGGEEVKDAIVIGEFGAGSWYLFLDPNRPGDDGEWMVVDWQTEFSTDYPSLLAFLESSVRTAAYA